MFCGSLRRMCFLLLLDEVFYRHQLYPVDWWCCWVQLWSYWFSACWICPFLKRMLKSSAILVDSSVSPLGLSVFASIFCCSVVRHIPIKDLTMSSWRIAPFIICIGTQHRQVSGADIKPLWVEGAGSSTPWEPHHDWLGGWDTHKEKPEVAAEPEDGAGERRRRRGERETGISGDRTTEWFSAWGLGWLTRLCQLLTTWPWHET